MSAAPTVALVLAAGLGTRMGRLTRTRPKPLLRVGGRTLLDRTIDRAIEAGARRIVVNVHAHAEQMRAHLAGRTDIPVSISIEDERLDTGGGAAKALDLVGAAEFLVLNADWVWLGREPLAPLVAAWRRSGGGLDGLLLLVPPERALAHPAGGDFLLAADGGLRRAKGAPGALVAAGAHVFRSASLARAGRTARGPWSLNAWWEDRIAAGRLGGVTAGPGRWIDVGTPAGLALAGRPPAPAPG